MDATYPSCSCCNPVFNHFLLQLIRRKFFQGTANFTAAVTGAAQSGQAQANVAAAITGGGAQSAQAKTASVQNLSQSDTAVAEPASPQPTIYVAKKIITMEASQPEATAVAVAGDTILAVGSLKQVQKKLQALGYSLDENTIDPTFESKVILPGFVEHHIHPLLGAMTMAVEIIAIEDWTVPGKGTSEAVTDAETYKTRLKAAIEQMSSDPDVAEDETFFTWGYHHYFHDEFYRTELDEFCQNELNEKDRNRPIVIWHRSCHEFIFNKIALDKYGITEDLIAQADEHTQSQASWKDGHFFEKGMELILGKIAGDLLNPDRVEKGLNIFRQYLLSKGVTTICEPGTQMNLTIQEVWNESLNTEDAAFRTYFIPDGRALYDQHKSNNTLGTLIRDTESWLDKGWGKVQWLPKQIKLFADGAIFSQLMQLQDPYLDGHEGQWIAEPDDYKAAFKLYWEAGYQINTHVNGDEGLRVVVETLAENMETYPREDHRFTVVHFAVSTKEQVKALGEMGAIVTANPYYVTALVDKYSKEGLGPARAENMVRLGSVVEEGMVIGLHSDMPMAPADPLFLAWCAANRITPKHKHGVAPHQCISVERALSAVTIEAAYCLGLDNEIGSIKPHKKANFTILEDDPLTVRKKKLKDIPVWGCVFEGAKYPVPEAEPIQPEPVSAKVPFDLKPVHLAEMATSRG